MRRVVVTPTLMELFGREVTDLIKRGSVEVNGKLPVKSDAESSWAWTALLLASPVVYLAVIYLVFKKSQDTTEDVRSVCCT